MFGQKGCTNRLLRPISYMLLFVTLAVTMISFCTSNWYSIKIPDHVENSTRTQVTIYYKGLWNVCKNGPDWNGECVFLPPTPPITSTAQKNETQMAFDLSEEYLTTVRVLYSMSVMLILGALGYPPFYKNMSDGVLKIGIMSLLTAGAGACTLIAMIIMTDRLFSDLNSIPTFGYSYITGWVAALMSLFAAVSLYVASKDNVYEERIY